MRPLLSLSPIMLALSVAGAGAAAAQETPDKVFLPWQKPQPTAHPPSDFTEILPWLLPEGGNKGKSRDAAAGWKTQVTAPKEPVTPAVAEPAFAENRLETGGIAPNGLVLKTPMPTRIKTAGQAETAAAAPTPKIKKSITLPGDRPVGQGQANEVSPGTAPVAQQAAADEAPAVPATLAEPVDADDAFSPVPEQQPLAAGAGIESARPVHRDGVDAATALPGHAAAVAAHPVRDPQAVRTQTGAPSPTQAVAPAEQTAAAGRTETAQAAGVPSIEAAPAMPQAEEAPPIPDALPEAIVTPVAKPTSPDLPVQRAKDLPEAPAASTQATQAENVTATGAGAAPQSKPRAPDRLVDGASVAQQYCFNIADAAKDARYAWQKKTLADIETELNKRIALLDERTAEYQKWLARRDEFIRNAEDNVVKIYAGMKVDAAAVQLALMNEETAAAVLTKLNTRNASAILNEMEPGKASKLTMIITGAAKLKRKKELERAPAAQGADAAPPSGTPAVASEGGRS